MNEIKETTLTPGTAGPPPAAQQHHPVHQVDPSKPYAYYQFFGDGVLLAELIATEEDCQGFKAKQEYWRFAAERTSIDTTEFNVVNVKKESGEGRTVPFSPDAADFVCSLTPNWGALAPNFPVPCHHYDDPFGPCGFHLKVDRPDARSAWVGSITWVRPLERFAPLFESRDDYQLTKVVLDQGETVANLVGTYWTPPITGYGDGEWKDKVVSTEPATGIQVNYGGHKVGIANARLVYPDGSFSEWTSDDTDGTNYPPCASPPSDCKANLGYPVNQVSVRTGWYLNYSLGPVNLECGGGWVTPYEPDKNTKDIPVFIPERCVVVGIQGKKRAGYGLVDLKIAYREVP